MSLTLEGVEKRYGKKQALRGVSAELGEGVYGLLGPNGAGKTTLIRTVVGLLPPTAGRVLLDGRDIRSFGSDYYRHVGYLPQYPPLYPRFTAREFLLYMAAEKALPRAVRSARVEELLEFVHLTADADRRVSTFSGGMKQRLGIAQAMLNDPKVLVLDEPTAGLDPRERMRFRSILSGLSGTRTVLLATHIVSDLEQVAERVLLLREGLLLRDRSPKELLAEVRGLVYTLDVPTAQEVDFWMESGCVSNVRRHAGGYTLRVVAREAPAGGVPVEPTLEDVYLCFFEVEDTLC